MVVFYYSRVILESCNGAWALGACPPRAGGWLYGVALYILVLFLLWGSIVLPWHVGVCTIFGWFYLGFYVFVVFFPFVLVLRRWKVVFCFLFLCCEGVSGRALHEYFAAHD